MPNWCSNVVELYHADSEMMNRAKTAFQRGEFLDEFIPVPKDLKIVAGRIGADDDEAQIALEKKIKENQEKYGYDTWYDFCVSEWGTKWDIGGDDAVLNEGHFNNVTLTFDSAWSPPINAYEKLVEMGFMIRAYYYEPGMQFCGVWENGNDEYYQLGDYETAEEVAESIPEALDEMFGISEYMAEWEEENAEEDEEELNDE
jgi:Ferredoxin-like domain in Api92-like protein